MSQPNLSAEVLRFLSKRSDNLAQARNDPNAFIEYVFGFHQGRMHREWQSLLDKYQHLVLIAPRYHGKTAGVPIARSLWHLGKDPNELIKIVCQSDSKAKKRLAALRDHIETNDALHRVFPHLAADRMVEWNKHMIRVERKTRSPDPSIEALGITSSASGDRATRLYFDDAADRRNSITLPKVRASIIESFDDWVNLLGPDGWLAYIATLWHTADLSHALMKNPTYHVGWYELDLKTLGSYVKLPDGTERRSKKPLWGDEDKGPWNIPALKARRARLGERKFARGFSNKPMLDSEQRISHDYIHYWGKGEGPKIGGEGGWDIVVSLDLASSQSKTADWTGTTIFAVRPDVVKGGLTGPLQGAIKIVDAFHAKIGFPEKSALVRGLIRQYDPVGKVVERAAGGIELAEHLFASYGIEVDLAKPKSSKGDRLDSVTPYLEAGIVELHPRLNPELGFTSEERGCLVGEFTGFPFTESDDVLDSAVHGLRWITSTYPALYGLGDEDDEGAGLEGDTRVILI
jgi:phage terminase large subunit-like protein